MNDKNYMNWYISWDELIKKMDKKIEKRADLLKNQLIEDRKNQK